MKIVQSLEQTQRGLRFKPPKNNRSRVVVLPAFASEELRRRKKEQAEELLRCGVRQSQDTLLCTRPDGEPMTPVQLTHRFTRLTANQNGLPKLRFHDLRHTHATQLLLAGVHPRIAQERLGHSTVALTLDLYSHVTSAMQDDAAAKINAALGGSRKPAR